LIFVGCLNIEHNTIFTDDQESLKIIAGKNFVAACLDHFNGVYIKVLYLIQQPGFDL